MSVFTVTTQFLLRRLKRADAGWEKAMIHPHYRDEPSEDAPFTVVHELRYWWADTWRQEVHWIEGELFKQKDVRTGMVEGLTIKEPLTIFEPI